VASSPHIFEDVEVSFCKHNEGRNWRRVFFDRECWVLLLGLPNDYWTEPHIHSIFGEFGKVQRWVADDRFRARLLIRIRVNELAKIPQFILYTDPENVDGDSWTLQCEVLQPHEVQIGPPMEEPVPENVDMEVGVPFDFFGLGQPLNGPNVQDGLNDNQNNAGDQLGQQQPMIQAQEQPMMQVLMQDLNEAPAEMELGNINLNIDLHPVIFNPVPIEEGNNGIGHEVHLLQHQGEVYFVQPPAEEELSPHMEGPQQLNGEQDGEGSENSLVPQEDGPENNPMPPAPLAPPVVYQEEEIPVDQLLGSDSVHNDDHALQAVQNVHIQHEEALRLDLQIGNTNHNEPEQLSEASVNKQHEEERNVDNRAEILGPSAIVAEDGSKSAQEIRSQEVIKSWGQFPNKGMEDDVIVKVPSDWFHFFTSMLLSPEKFGWAKEFMSTAAIHQITENQGTVSCIVPKECPDNRLPCNHSSSDFVTSENYNAGPSKGVVIGEVEEIPEETPVPYKKRRGSRRSTPLVDTEVRRSARFLENNNGYKVTSCPSKKCFCCIPKPPTLSSKAIKNLAVQFCGMEEKNVNEEVLAQKKKKVNPIAKTHNPEQAGPRGRKASSDEKE
jgi:hypothetical protein